MAVQRVFLGWDGPALRRAAAWLGERFGAALAEPIVAVPTARAGRRLLELLVDQAGDALASVPDIVTTGDLPEQLHEPRHPIADDWTAAVLRLRALRQAAPAALQRMAPAPPEEDDLPAWWALAQRLAAVVEDLAADGLTIAAVIDRIRRRKLDDRAVDRLEALQAIEAGYLRELASCGLQDCQQARLDAITTEACRCERPVVLVCTADLSAQLAAMVRQLRGPVYALIHAPPDAAPGFDALGRFVVDYWRQQTPPITEDQCRFVDRPADQARQVVAELAARATGWDDVTVGLGEPALAATVRRAIEHAGGRAREAAGRPVDRSRPALLLRELGRFAGTRRFDDLASLLRHPDMLAWLGDSPAVEDWLSLLDRYASDHVQRKLAEPWLGDERRRAAMRALWNQVAELIPAEPIRPLSHWAQDMASALGAVYAGEYTRHAPQQHALVVALGRIGEALSDLAAIEVDTPRVTFPQAVTLLLEHIGRVSVPEPGGEAAIELMGFLELPLDDAGHLVLTGVNEGRLPAARVADPWLADSMRGALGMVDNAHRLARDAYLLTAMLHSRKVTLIAGRRSAEGDPLAPSRLLLMGDDEQLVRRVRDFYAEDLDERVEPPLLLTPGDRDQFLIPPPFDAPPVREMSVTAFRDYLACPYRFYLRHVLKLRGLDDRAVELDALAFGTLAHDVMQAFAEDEARDSTDPTVIARFFNDRLDLLARVRYGDEPRMAVRLQIEQLRRRLEAFAPRQAQMRREGWRIMEHAERKLRTTLTFDGETFTLTGRVDRIDQYGDESRYRILDYKTGETGRRPEQTHQRGGEWVDLQLPLYRDLCAPLGVTGKIELGYINLPKKLEDVGAALAEWDAAALQEAQQVRDTVICAVMAGRFWPPGEPMEDEFAAICADLAFDREVLIRASREARHG